MQEGTTGKSWVVSQKTRTESQRTVGGEKRRCGSEIEEGEEQSYMTKQLCNAAPILRIG